jgi:hypothetical protein
MKAVKKVEIMINFLNNQVEKCAVLIEEVKCITKVKLNLFSISLASKKDVKLKSEGASLILKKLRKRLRSP